MIEHWIIPCNVKFFDLIDHFKNNKTVVWKNAFTIKKDDIVYVYIGSPYSEIRYKCRVISDKVDDALLEKNSYAIPKHNSNNYFSKKTKYIQLELVCEYPTGTYKLTDLKDHGLGQVQIQARTDRRLQAYLDKVESLL